uniref:Strictosidine synthase conserved region domain-containing protein n=1 Tax=Photinus pyralis TaxID=7054 RepID=A0A1Y1MAF0_PHOPY
MGIVKFLTVRAVEGVVAVLLITFMPNLPPDAKYSLNYNLTPVMPFEGALTLNDKLQSTEVWHKGDFNGPEAYGVYNGELYTSIHGGNVIKLIGESFVPVVKFGKQCKGFYQEHICGRPLGFQFDKHGGLYVADAYYGIYKVDMKTGKQLQLISMDQEINGKKPKMPNSVAIASNGDIYWTDSSTEFFLYDGVYDMLADGSGRLIHYDGKTKQNTVLIDKLHFANGIRLAVDESFVITTETARCRVYRYHLKGPKKGTYDIFLDGLPGLPDNIQTDGKDGFLIPLVVGRDDDYPPPLNILGPFPLLRKFLSRLLGLTELAFQLMDKVYPSEWAEKAVHYIGHFASIPHSFSSPRQTILHISKDGVILDSIHSLNGSIVGMSEAFIFKDMLYMGSPFNDYIGRISLEKVGWGHLALKDSYYPSSTAETPTLKVASETASAQPTPKAAASQPTTAPPQKATSTQSSPTTQRPPKVVTQAPEVTTQSPDTKPSPIHTTQAPPTTRPPPPPSKQSSPPPPPVQQTPPPPKQTPPPPPSGKQTPPPPPPPKQVPPPPPPTKQSPPPPTSTTQAPPPSTQTSPPSPKQTPPRPAKQVPPPSPSTKQTPSPPSTKQTPPPPKQTPPPPSPTKQAPPPPTTQAPPTPASTTPPPPNTKPLPPATQFPKVASPAPSATSQQLPSHSKELPPQPPKVAPTAEIPKETPQQPSPSLKAAPPKEQPSKVSSSAQPSKPSPSSRTQGQPTPKQASSKTIHEQSAEGKNEL